MAKRGICLSHCTEVTALPQRRSSEARILRAGAEQRSAWAVVGMAGTYGHEVKTTPTRWISTRFHGSRRSSVYRATGAW